MTECRYIHGSERAEYEANGWTVTSLPPHAPFCLATRPASNEGQVSIALPWPAKALHSNSRAHWAAKHRATAKARQEASVVAKSAGVGCWPEATILIEYYPPTRRGDPQNVPTSLKAYIDGISDAMGCDDRGFKVDYPREFAGTKKGGEVVFQVSP